MHKEVWEEVLVNFEINLEFDYMYPASVVHNSDEYFNYTYSGKCLKKIQSEKKTCKYNELSHQKY